MKLKNMYIGFVIKDFLLFVVLSWTSQRIFFNVINDDSTADAIAGVIVGIVILLYDNLLLFSFPLFCN